MYPSTFWLFFWLFFVLKQASEIINADKIIVSWYLRYLQSDEITFAAVDLIPTESIFAADRSPLVIQALLSIAEFMFCRIYRILGILFFNASAHYLLTYFNQINSIQIFH